MLSYVLSFVIVAQNLAARIGFIQLTKIIKFTSNSARTRFILVCVFIIYFLNYGVMWLLAPMHIDIPIMSFSQAGIYYDFNQYWYGNIGYQVVTTMVINAIFPPLEAGLIFFVSFALRSYDQGRCCRKVPAESTKQKTLFAFINLYSGSEFEIYYQYSQMLVITWVTFLFGPALPILFPIALFGMAILYVTNRITVAYWHRRPPVYDSKMNETTIDLLSAAPLLYACMGAWVYSN